MIGAAWDALLDVMRFSDNEHLRAHIAMGVINFHDRKYAAQRQEEVKALNEAFAHSETNGETKEKGTL